MNDVVKKRIVGAAVLIAAGVLVPLLLARWLHDPQLDQQAMRVYEITPSGEVQAVTAAGGGDQAVTQAPVPTTNDEPDDPRMRMAATQEMQFDAPAKQENDAPGSATDSGQTPRPSNAIESPKQDTAADESPQAGRAPPQPVTTPEPDNSGAAAIKRSVAPGAWVVQVASFAKQSNARALALALNEHFAAFYTQAEINGRTWYRVRVGPLASEAAANNTAGELRALGHNTLVQQVE